MFDCLFLLGDVTIDLEGKFFLSVDWKNNDKMAGYVLVQSKEMVRIILERNLGRYCS